MFAAASTPACGSQYEESVGINSGRGVVDVTSLTTAAAAAAEVVEQCSRQLDINMEHGAVA